MCRPDVYRVLYRSAKSRGVTLGVSTKVLADRFKNIAEHYRTGSGHVDFADPITRLAYNLAYVPVGIDAARKAIDLVFTKPEPGYLPVPFNFMVPERLTVLSLGAGPCTELLAIIEALGAGSLRRITCHAFDGVLDWREEAGALVNAWADAYGMNVHLEYHELNPVGLGGVLDDWAFLEWDAPSIVIGFRFTKWMGEDVLRDWFGEIAKRAPMDTIVILADACGGANSASAKHAIIEQELAKHRQTTTLLSTKKVEVSNMSWQIPDFVKKIALEGDAHPPVSLELTVTSFWLR